MKGTSQVSLQTLLRRSQSLRVRSWLPETIRALSSKNLADRTLPLWPVRVCWGQEIHMVKLSISTCSNCNLHVSCIAWQKKHLLQLNRDHHWVGVLIIRVQPGTGKHRSAFAAVSPVPQQSVHLHFTDRWQLQHSLAGQSNDKGLKHAENGNCAFLLSYGDSLKDTTGYQVSTVITP